MDWHVAYMRNYMTDKNRQKESIYCDFCISIMLMCLV